MVLSHKFGFRAEEASKREQQSSMSSTRLISEGTHYACCG